MNQEWYHQIKNHWATKQPLTAISCIYPRVLSTEELLKSIRGYVTAIQNPWICNKKSQIFNDTKGIVIHQIDQKTRHNGNLSASSNNILRLFRNHSVSSGKKILNQ